MKIIFIIGCIAPGKDGVGDYTRSLSMSLIKQGHKAKIIATHDKFVSKEINEYQEQGGVGVECKRIPYIWSDTKRISLITQELLVGFSDCVSLQYVPYSFQENGLPLRYIVKLMKLLSGYRVNIMFHELWIGVGKHDSYKNKILGLLQKYLVIRMVRNLNHPIITTSNKVYQYLLMSAKIESQVLSLFSNIDRVEGGKASGNILLRTTLTRYSGSNYMVLGVFGSLHPKFDLSKEVLCLLKKVNSENKKLILMTFGRSNSLSVKRIDSFELQHKGSVEIVRLGELSSDDISRTLSILSLAIVGKPRTLLGKSGVFAAMRLHGVPVMSVHDPNWIHLDKIAEDEISNLLQRPTESWKVSKVACQFVDVLSSQQFGVSAKEV